MQSCQKACKTLEIDTANLSVTTVRKQYKLMVLKYHPDKNKTPDAHAKFLEVQEAHDFLLKYLDIHSHDEEPPTWSSSVSSFFETLYNNEHLQKRVFHPLLMKIIETCETKIFEKMDATRATKIYNILLKYKESLHLSDDFLKRVSEIIRGAPIRNAFVLNPNLDDMLSHSVYKLKMGDETFLVPLWHSELIYNKSCIVQCEPELPDNVELDEDNGVHVYLSYNLLDLWREGASVEYFLGSKKCCFPVESLYLKKEQVIVKPGEGIPVANEVDIFSNERLSDVYLHISLHL